MSYTGPLALGLNNDKPHTFAPSNATILAVVVGNALEWYEVVVYGYLAAVIAALYFPAHDAGTSLLLFSVAMAAGRMIIGAMPRLDPFVIMMWGCGLTTVAFLAGSYLPSAPLALAACVLAGFTGSCLWPTTLAVTADRYPGGGAGMFGLLAPLGNAGGIFMPWLVGWISDRSDLRHGLAISALAPALMLPLLLWMRAGRKPA